MRWAVVLLGLGAVVFAKPEPVYEWPQTKGYEAGLRLGVRYYEEPSVIGAEPYAFFDYRISYPFLVGVGGSYVAGSISGFSIESRFKIRIPVYGRWKLDPKLSVLYSELKRANRSRKRAGGSLEIELLRFSAGESFFGMYLGYAFHTDSRFNFWRFGVAGGF